MIYYTCIAPTLYTFFKGFLYFIINECKSYLRTDEDVVTSKICPVNLILTVSLIPDFS